MTGRNEETTTSRMSVFGPEDVREARMVYLSILGFGGVGVVMLHSLALDGLVSWRVFHGVAIAYLVGLGATQAGVWMVNGT